MPRRALYVGTHPALGGPDAMWRRNSAVADDIELCVRWRPGLRQTCPL